MRKIYEINFLFIIFSLIHIKLGFSQSPGSNSHLPDSTKLPSVSLVFSHNMAISKKGGWVYAQQTLSPYDQLNLGSRGGKTPIGWWHKKDLGHKISKIFTKKETTNNPPRIVLMHQSDPHQNNQMVTILQRGGKDPEEVDVWFKDIANFAQKNPTEYMYFSLEAYLSRSWQSEKNAPAKYARNKLFFADDEIAEILDKKLELAGLSDHIMKVSNLKDWQAKTLGDLRKSKKGVIITISDKNIAKYSKYLSEEIHQAPHWADTEKKGCKWFGVKEEGRATLINVNPEMSFTKEDHRVLNALKPLRTHLQKKFGPQFKANDYTKVNSKENIEKRHAECRDAHSEIYKNGIIVSSDHVHQGDLFKYVDDLNASLLKK